MKQKTKITITALVAMLFMALAVTFISFSFADESGNSGSETDVSAAETLTNIDYIVKNSNDTTLSDSDQQFRIVEIGSCDQSTLGTYCTSLGFENYVINGNKTISDMFNSGKVKYNFLKASDLTSSSTTNGETVDGEAVTDFSIISQADLIYISNGSSAPFKNGGNDLCEDLVSLLQPMLVGSYIPVIIDMPDSSGSKTPGTTSTTVATMGNLIGDVLAKKGYLYDAFGFDTSKDATWYFNTSLNTESGYLTINAQTQDKAGRYTKVKVGNDGTAASMGRMLVISASGNALTSGTVASKLLAGASKVDTTNLTTVVEDGEGTAVTGTVYDITSTVLYTNGYYSRYKSSNPKYIKVDDISLATLEAEYTTKSADDYTNFTQYDMIFIESDLKSSNLSNQLYNDLSAAMYGNVHIVYDKASSVATSKSSSGTTTNPEADSTNYMKIYNMISSSNVAAYSNVMLTDKSKMDIITGSTNAAGGKQIADLINSSSYRGIGGPSSTSSTFSVLEIEPCYPIDTTIAENEGTYYSDATAMLNGLSLEEIQAQREQAGLSTDLDGSFEYYAWELSKAKIADALDMDANNITLTQMSTEEFSSNKKEILGNYDLVYIGGNNTAFKDFDKYYSWQKLISDEKDAYLTRVLNASDYESLKYLPIYRMYAHNSDMTALNNLGTNGSGTSILKTVKTTDGETVTYDKAVTMLNGNDISGDNLTYLEAYVDAGMPIVFSSDVSEAYNYIANASGDDKYLQNSIDPDSNMCKLLDYCSSKTDSRVSIADTYSSTTNILWNLHVVDKDASTTYTEEVSSDGGRLSQYANKVKVLNETQRNNLKSLYLRSSKRPKLILTSQPAIYNFFDDSTIITDSSLTYKIDKTALNTTNYTISLYIDDDGNSKFDASSEKAKASISENSDTGTITVKTDLESSFYGPLYWKLELVDNSNSSKPTVSITGLSYVNPGDTPKQEVHVLQILPWTRNVGGTGNGEGSGGLNGLYFCTDCQEGYKNLYYNSYNHSSTFGQFSYYYSGGLNDNGISQDGTAYGVKMGLHEHQFGIVSYDSSINQDDWSYNLANDLKDRYDFDVDIMYRTELDRYSNEIVATYSGAADDAAKDAISEGYLASETKVRELYNEQKAISDSAAACLEDMIKNSTMMASAKEEILEKGSYSEYYALQDTEKGSVTTTEYEVKGMFYTQEEYDELADKTGAVEYTNYKDMYEAWVDAHDKMLLLKGGYYVNNYTYQYIDWYIDTVLVSDLEGTEKTTKAAEYKAKYTPYNKYYSDGGIESSVRIMGYKDYEKFANYGDWLSKTYTTVCIGVSERFADDDITNENSLDAIDTYVADGGQLILFHDTLSPYSDSGAVQLTAHLREVAGLDKYHLVEDTSNVKDTESKVALSSAQVTLYTDNQYDTTSIDPAISSGSDSISTECVVNITKQSGWGYVSCNNEPNKTSYFSKSNGGTTLYKITLKDSSGNAMANQSVTLQNTSDWSHQVKVTGTTDSKGYVEISMPNYYTETIPASETSYYVPFTTTKSKYSTDVYFMTNLSYKTGDSSYTGFKSDFSAAYKGNSVSYNFVPGGYTDTVYQMNGTSSAGESNYKYAGTISWSGIHAAMQDAQFNKGTKNYATNRAKKNNDAIVTMYPYQLADEIYIGGTHPQAYATDVDNDDLTILYSFIGGTADHDNTATFAADPGDGTDNYFMFACKNVYYCGAGHAKVTGAYKDNQNERYLYLNVICNAVRNSAFAPSIDVYDHSSTADKKTNNIVKELDDGSYEMKVEEDEEYPEFSFIAGVDDDEEVKDIKIYYDLNYYDYSKAFANEAAALEELGSLSGYTVAKQKDGSVLVTKLKKDGYEESSDVLIAHWGDKVSDEVAKVYTKDTLDWITGTDTKNLKTYDDGGTLTTRLKLKEEYFSNYGGKYTYIVIQVTDTAGNIRYQRIKVSYKDKMFNLTQSDSTASES